MQESAKLVTYATEQERVTFFKKTYTHVAWAILAFIAVESLLIRIVPAEAIFLMVSKRWVWLLILGGFLALVLCLLKNGLWHKKEKCNI